MEIKQHRMLVEVAIFSLVVMTAGVERKELFLRLQVLSYVVGLTWLLFIFDSLLLGKALLGLGVRPRTLSGLLCIPSSIFVHLDEYHLWGNTEGFFLFGGRLLFLKGIDDFVLVTLTALFVAGIGIWLFGQTGTNHIGASGIVLGYFGFLLGRGFFEKDPISVLLTLLMIAFYSTTLSHLLPTKGVSWEGHFFGFSGGVIAAVCFNPIRETLLPYLSL